MVATEEVEVNCTNEECICLVVPGEGIEHAGELYCSADCASGGGCRHPDCNCAIEIDG